MEVQSNVQRKEAVFKDKLDEDFVPFGQEEVLKQMEKYNPINSSNEASNKTGTSPVKLQKTGFPSMDIEKKVPSIKDPPFTHIDETAVALLLKKKSKSSRRRERKATRAMNSAIESASLGSFICHPTDQPISNIDVNQIALEKKGPAAEDPTPKTIDERAVAKLAKKKRKALRRRERKAICAMNSAIESTSSGPFICHPTDQHISNEDVQPMAIEKKVQSTKNTNLIEAIDETAVTILPRTIRKASRRRQKNAPCLVASAIDSAKIATNFPSTSHIYCHPSDQYLSNGYPSWLEGNDAIFKIQQMNNGPNTSAEVNVPRQLPVPLESTTSEPKSDEGPPPPVPIAEQQSLPPFKKSPMHFGPKIGEVQRSIPKRHCVYEEIQKEVKTRILMKASDFF